MARNNDNYYVRAQEEANRIAAKQHRVLTDIAKLAKSSNEELRKFRKAFEAFSEAMLGLRIEPFQGAVLSEAARGQVAEFDIKGFKETLQRGESLTVPEGKPYPKVEIVPDHTKKVVHAGRAPRLGYGDVVEARDEYIEQEREAGKAEEEVADMGLVIGVDLSEEHPEEKALIAARGTVEGNDRLTIVCDEAATRELLLDVEEDSQSLAVGYDMVDVDDMMIEEQRRGLVHRVRKVL